MGTETVYLFPLLIYLFIWRYSPRNGDGNVSIGHCNNLLLSIWRYSPRNGDGNKTAPLLVYLVSGFGDIVPGMGTETIISIDTKSSDFKYLEI